MESVVNDRNQGQAKKDAYSIPGTRPFASLVRRAVSVFIKMPRVFPHLVVGAGELKDQGARLPHKQEPRFDPSPAFIQPRPQFPDSPSRVQVRMPKGRRRKAHGIGDAGKPFRAASLQTAPE
ncbi:MAG: hypothetical protein LBM92_08055 [Opitutaceae bacterium]|nr:hypothetical protein [Opitutaceae bacterium]